MNQRQKALLTREKYNKTFSIYHADKDGKPYNHNDQPVWMQNIDKAIKQRKV